MITSNEMLVFVKNELTSIVMALLGTSEKNNAAQIANDILKLIDWNNSALMHKGLSWMAKNYLVQQNMI